MSLYNIVEYPGAPFAQTHPDRLATMAALHGLSAPDPAACRVLEIGCGDGGNLIPMAVTMPGATFVGFDLAESAIVSGNRTSAVLGLTNITLQTADIASVDDSWGQFDYILAHGVYTWVPPPVQEHILRIVRENLSPEGIAYVSYNALPGSSVRRMLREMMLFHTRNSGSPQDVIQQSGELLGFITSARTAPGPFQTVIADEVRSIRAKQPWLFFHDDLSQAYNPVYFHQFMAAAQSHQLAFFCEADFHDLSEFRFTPDAVQHLQAMAGADRILRQQYADFANGRSFRQTLLVHQGRPLSEPTPDRLHGLYLSTAVRQTEHGVFQGPRSAGMKTDDPHIIALMTALIEAAPQAIPVASLAHSSRDDEFFLHATFSGVTDLHRGPRPLVNSPGPQPVASPLARHQAAHGSTVTTLLHSNIRLESDEDRLLLAQLDGTLTLEQLGKSRPGLDRFASMGLLMR